MKNTEVRIGNTVLINGEEIQIISVDKDGINRKVRSGPYGEYEEDYDGYFEDSVLAGYSTKNIKPVVLTEDRLKQYKFPRGCYDVVKKEGRYYLCIDLPNLPTEKGTSKIYIRPIDAVHELQNQYWAAGTRRSSVMAI